MVVLDGCKDTDDVSDWTLEAVQGSVGNRIVLGISSITMKFGNDADRMTAAQIYHDPDRWSWVKE